MGVDTAGPRQADGLGSSPVACHCSRLGTWGALTADDRSSMPAQSTATTLRTLDGLHLAGTLVTPEDPPDRVVVLVHGGGVTREEGGFFTRLARGLAEAGIASLRYDLRGHGESEGRQEE